MLALREAAGEELLELVRAALPELDASHLRQLFRNPFVGAEELRLLANERRLLAIHEVRTGLASHPRSPTVLALRFVPGLHWRELLELGLDVRVHPTVRAAGDRYLAERLPALAEGEKTSIARRAGQPVLARLRHDPSRRVIAALLENPRLTEGVLFPLLSSEATLPAILALVAANPRWGSRYEVRLALAKNSASPLEVALRLLPMLKKVDLKAVASLPRVSSLVRRRARLLLGEA